MRKYPFRAITVATKEVGRYRTITSAGEFLAHGWPTEKGPTHLKAHIACLDVAESAVGISAARDALIDALKEKDI